jgi:hypothetical protein
VAAIEARAGRAEWSLGLAPVAAALGLGALAITRDTRWFALGDGSGWSAAAAVLAGWALIAGAMVVRGVRAQALRRARDGRRVRLVRPGAHGLGAGPSVLFTASLLLSGLGVQLALLAAFAYATGRVDSSLERSAVGPRPRLPDPRIRQRSRPPPARRAAPGSARSPTRSTSLPTLSVLPAKTPGEQLKLLRRRRDLARRAHPPSSQIAIAQKSRRTPKPIALLSRAHVVA